MKKRNLKYFSIILLILIYLLLYSCNIDNPFLPSESYADAGDDLSSYVGSYVILDPSNSHLENNVYMTRWKQNQNNPDQLQLLSCSDFYPINKLIFFIEGEYEFYLEIEDEQGDFYTDTLIVDVKPRQFSIIEDIEFEGKIRQTLDYPEGPLNNLKLKELDTLQVFCSVFVDGIDNLEGLQFCTELSYLNFLGLKATDISPVSTLTKLKYFDYNQSHCLENITPLSDLTSLEYLILHSNNISNIEALRNLTNLKELDLTLNPITDISPLQDLHHLEILKMAGSPEFERLSDISPLSTLTSLRELYLPYEAISDISPLSNLTGLESLRLYSNNITDLLPLLYLYNLRYLNVDRNSIQSLSGICNLDNLTGLSASSNLISDINDLEFTSNLKSFGLSFNNITNIEPLINNPNIGDGCYIFLDNNPLDSISINIYIPNLQERGARVLF